MAAFIAGAGLAYILDPQSGRRRRHVLRDRTAAMLRRGRRRSVGKARYVAGHVEGAATEAAHAVARHEQPADDATVKDRILSQAFREAGVSTTDVSVDVVDGIATLRGTLSSADLAQALIERVRAVSGVRTVTPRLTVPGVTGGQEG
jgi:hyperosmotically inducible periplasmic protein